MRLRVFAACVVVLALVVSAGTPALRVAVRAEGDNGSAAKLVSLLSKEIRGLDGVSVVDDSPQFTVSCSAISLDMGRIHGVGYAASVAVVSADGHLLVHFVQSAESLEGLAHEVALAVDGGILEHARRTLRAR
jgi:hypothetical protein